MELRHYNPETTYSLILDSIRHKIWTYWYCVLADMNDDVLKSCYLLLLPAPSIGSHSRSTHGARSDAQPRTWDDGFLNSEHLAFEVINNELVLAHAAKALDCSSLIQVIGHRTLPSSGHELRTKAKVAF